MGTETLSIQLPRYDCCNDPNWTDEALKQCRYKGDGFHCMLCCNENICRQWEEPITITFDTLIGHLSSSMPVYDEIWEELQPPPRMDFVEWNF